MTSTAREAERRKEYIKYQAEYLLERRGKFFHSLEGRRRHLVFIPRREKEEREEKKERKKKPAFIQFRIQCVVCI